MRKFNRNMANIKWHAGNKPKLDMFTEHMVDECEKYYAERIEDMWEMIKQARYPKWFSPETVREWARWKKDFEQLKKEMEEE